MNQGTIIISGVFLCIHVWEREGVHMHMTGRRQRGRKMERERESVHSVCNLLLRFGNGRFASSTPISLLWHSSPLNRIDYWFCSLRRLWDFPSGSLCSKECWRKAQVIMCTATQWYITYTNGEGFMKNLVIAAIYFSGGWGLSWC